MSKETCFWDSSALVPLFVHQHSTRAARAHLRRFTPVVWWAALIEVHSAIARLHGSGKLTEVEKSGALSRLDLLRRAWKEIIPSDSLRDLAKDLLHKHELRAADSFQLAAALTWCREQPARRTLISADQRLSAAAAAVGFSVINLI